MLKARRPDTLRREGPLQNILKQIEFGPSRIFIKHAGRPAVSKSNLSIGPLCRNISLQHIEANRLHSGLPSQADGVLRHRLGYALAGKGRAHA